MRQQRLLIARDADNVAQGVHGAAADLAATVRDLDNAYEQYRAFKETREAAYDNLQVQIAQFKTGRVAYLNVLQAINDWGNAVSSEAQQLLAYNVDLAVAGARRPARSWRRTAWSSTRSGSGRPLPCRATTAATRPRCPSPASRTATPAATSLPRTLSI